MEDYKYSNIEEIIKNNSHLKNEELAKKVGKSISWVKAFKAFMRAKDKEKYKDTKNPIYKAIYNIWIKDPKAQKKENEKNQLKKCKNELRKCKRLSTITEKELTDYKTKYNYLLENLEKELEKEKEKLERELNEKYTPIIKEYYKRKKELEEYEKRKKELEEERRNYEEARLEYIEKEREFKKIVKVLTIIIFVEFLLLLFNK